MRPGGRLAGTSRADGRTLLFKRGTVLTLDPALGDLRDADVLVKDGKIAAVGPGLEAVDAEAIDARDCIIMPGFVDSHRHCWQGLLRNIQPDALLSDYISLVLHQMAGHHRPEDVYLGTLVSLLGAVNAGVTTMLDWAHIQLSPEHSDACVQALADSGMRAVFGYAPPRQRNDDIHRIKQRYFASKDQLLTLALAPSGPGWGDFEGAMTDWRLARELDARITVHAGIPGGVPDAMLRLDEAGLLGPDTTYIHCAMFSDAEWQRIAATGGTVSISAPVELQMGHGSPAVQTALDHGIRPSLSVDVETSQPGDFFTQMRATLAFQRGMVNARRLEGDTETPRLLTARDVLEFATFEGARANGLGGLTGTLTPGKAADLILLRTDRINVMPINDPVGAVVLGMDSSNVDSVFVAGNALKRNGVLLNSAMRDLSARVAEAHHALMRRAGRGAPA
jgi:5-methylthioadenosine/S-adenosylhomocysteine deaminase